MNLWIFGIIHCTFFSLTIARAILESLMIFSFVQNPLQIIGLVCAPINV